MLYQMYQWHDDVLSPWRNAALSMLGMASGGFGNVKGFLTGEYMAALELLSRYKLSHTRPDFAIERVMSGNREANVTVDVALDLPFGKLLHFAKDIDMPQPKVLVVAPLSGHFSTLLRGTVETLLRDHDVYITDWTNARDVPLEAGDFGVEDYVAYIIRFVEEIGPGAHLLAVCQPCVQTLAAVAVMSADKLPATPRSMTLMAGADRSARKPDRGQRIRGNPSRSPGSRPRSFRPCRGAMPAAGRKVYPGFLQLVAFMAMNMDRHKTAHKKLYDHIAKGEVKEAEEDQELSTTSISPCST